jgi:6-phosphogluconolactonase
MAEAGMMNNLNFHRFDDEEKLAFSLAQSIVNGLNDAIAEKGSASLLVSGGSTPKKLFKALSTMDIEWDKIKIGLCDERLVEPTHHDSNEKLVRETLMTGYAAKATFISMANEDETACSVSVKELLMPFDVLVLGMGDDAHTASLFPNNPRLSEAYDQTTEKVCIKIIPQSAPHTRMSLTLGAILSAHHVYLHFQGESKLNVYKEALNGTDTFTMPIRAIINQTDKTIEVYSA